MPQVLIVAATTGYQTRLFADAARSLGLRPRLATDRCHILDDPWADDAIPVRFETPVESAQSAAAALRGSGMKGIVAVGDLPAITAAALAAELGLPFHSVPAATRAHSKLLAKEAFRAAGVPIADYQAVALSADSRELARRQTYPVVLKPIDLSASRGVIRANDAAEFVAAFERIRRMTGEPMLVEQFLPGREFAIEGIMTHSELRILAIFDKPDPLDGPFFEETIYVTPSRASAEVQRRMERLVGDAVRALGLTHGPIHAEVRANENEAWVLEVAARPIGGLCARVLRFTDGTSLESLILRHAVGQAIDGLRLADAASGVLMMPIGAGGVLQCVEGVDEARRVQGVVDVVVTAKQGHTLLPLPEGKSYLGFVFASGDSAEAVERSLREAHGRLQVSYLAVLPTLP